MQSDRNSAARAKLLFSPPKKKSSCAGTLASLNASLISLKSCSFLICSRLASCNSLLLTNSQFRTSSASTPNEFNRPSPSSSFGGLSGNS